MSDGDYVVEAEALSKRFGKRWAVRELDLAIARGAVCGLLGPNGAGKSTTLRMLLGLVRPTHGAVRLFGASLRDARLHVLKRVGCLIEAPAFYPHLSGRKNLELLGRISGGVDAARVQACLERVGLGDRGEDRTAGYSTGMKQRLGLAAAILHDPEFVLLDEPLNGLDPPAVLLVRRLIRSLAEEEGKTVLVSSHMLHEVEVTCDHVVLLRGGRKVVDGKVAELIKPDHARLELRVNDGEAALGWLRAQAGVGEVEEEERGPDGSASLVVSLAGAESAQLNRGLIEAGVEVSSLAPRRRSLEDLFAELTAEPAAVGAEEEGA
ncbi:MAG: ABC transporter ATP-binding protein [Planctomycetes bacterium]|nr:ABC transporter ATP-binding protein [Planctomycetota bacterium]